MWLRRAPEPLQVGAGLGGGEGEWGDPHRRQEPPPMGADVKTSARPWGCCFPPPGKGSACCWPLARSPRSSLAVQGAHACGGSARLWRINIPGTSPRPPAHAEENITAISGGSSACAQYLDGEFAVINLALSSSLRGPRLWHVWNGKELGSAASLRGLFGGLPGRQLCLGWAAGP